tara:strand:+ start:789 stop:1556 length:768 start_codon:yes stop_codon:yes gene_type:complete
MANHIFGFGDKVVGDTTGTLYDSGGPVAPYHAFEEDYFIIRRSDHASNTHIFFEVEEWSMADYDASARATDYDYIDVYGAEAGQYDPSSWEWVDRIGGEDINAESSGLLEEADLPTKFYLELAWLKFVFRSKYRQDYKTYSGFKISWFTGGSGDTSGYTDFDGIASTTYSDQSNLKENAMDSETIVISGVAADPAKTNWDFIPPGQFDDTNDLHVLNHRFTNMNYAKTSGQVPLSYTSPERIRLSEHVGNITIED